MNTEETEKVPERSGKKRKGKERKGKESEIVDRVSISSCDLHVGTSKNLVMLVQCFSNVQQSCFVLQQHASL